MIVKITNKKFLKNTTNQVTQSASEPQEIEFDNCNRNALLNTRATTLTVYKVTGKFFEKEVPCSQVSKRNKYRIDQ